MAAAQQQAAASVLQSFPFRAAVLALCVALLPLLPVPAQQAPPDVGAGQQGFLAKAWELLHLLFVGIAVSYGLFSLKNSADDDGRAAAAAAAAAGEKDDAAAAGPAEPAAKADARYAWRMFRDSIAPFDDDDDDFHDDVRVPDIPPTGGGGGGGGARASSWSALHRPVEPVVVVSTGGGGVRIGQAADAQAPLSLPVRALKPQQQQAQDAADAGDDDVDTPRARPRRRSSRDTLAAPCASDETVLPSPIPWRSRSGRRRDDARRPTPSPSPSPSPSPKRLSPASSLSRETQTTLAAKATTDKEYYAKAKRRSPYRSSSISSSSPPAPPPPPPPFLVHGYHPGTERRSAAARSFKEELQHHSMRGGRGEDHYSPRTSSFSNSSPAKARSSFDGGGGSSSSVSVGKSVRTFRAREPAVFQDQSQELPDDDDADAGDGRDARLDVHGSEEPYGYRDYQSIPRFQYERSGRDPILGGVAVSSDETESSDDDGDDGDVGGGGGGGYTTRESSPEVDENEVDKKAEEFIARFREQIRRQRIESIKKSAGPRGFKHHGK